MNELDQYITKLFSDPIFSALLSIFAIWYSFYLFRRPREKSALYFIYMTNHRKEKDRQTFILLLNSNSNDISFEDIYSNYPLMLSFSTEINLRSLDIVYKTDEQTKFSLLQEGDDIFKVQFDILRSNCGVLMLARHDSKDHEDDVSRYINVSGLVKNTELYQDDYSDQGVRRASSITNLAFLGAFLCAIVLSIATTTFAKAAGKTLSPSWFMIGYFFVSMFFVFRYLESVIGLDKYYLFWKFRKKAFPKEPKKSKRRK